MRILLISYYFPPCGGAAVQRWHRWIPQLHAAGIKVDVLTSSGGDYPVLDESLLDEIPDSVTVHRSPAPRLGRIWRGIFGKSSNMPHGSLDYAEHRGPLKAILLWARLNLIIPDMRVFWNPGAYKETERLIREYRYDAIISTGPPHSTHLIGLKLKRRFALRWIADFRDPWSEIHYLKLNPPCRISRSIHKRLEADVLAAADKCLVVSQHISDALPPGNKTVLYNGFDADKLSRFIHVPTDRFRVKYVGQITAGQDFPGMLDVLAKLDPAVDVSFIGTRFSTPQLTELKTTLGSSVRVVPHLSQTEALKEMVEAELLILLINYYEGAEGMLTTKLFEYIGSRTPILALGPHGGEAERCILEHKAGAYFDRKELHWAADFIQIVFQAWHKKADIRNARDLSALSAARQSVMLIKELRG